MNNMHWNEEIMYGIEPRFYALFCDLVDITHNVVLEEVPTAGNRPLFHNIHNEHFNYENNSINYVLEYDLGSSVSKCKITVSYYKPRGVVFVSQEIANNYILEQDRNVGVVMFIYVTGQNQSKNRFFNQDDMKNFWYYWLHQDLDGVPLRHIQNMSFETKEQFLAMKQQHESAMSHMRRLSMGSGH